jgi:hypothetical protein
MFGRNKVEQDGDIHVSQASAHPEREAQRPFFGIFGGAGNDRSHDQSSSPHTFSAREPELPRATTDAGRSGVGGCESSISGNKLDCALDTNKQGMLLKQASNLSDLPKFSNESQGSKSEKVREWKLRVDQKLAALHPVFRDFWTWSWTTGEGLYNHWLSLSHEARCTLCTSWQVPPEV